MAKKITSSSEPAAGLTGPQWAWQFLRRNPEYRAAFEMVSRLSAEQLVQLNFLIDQRKELLVTDDFLDENVIRTLDLRFFEAKDLDMVDEGISETVESYLERTSGIPGLDKTIVLKVSKRFWLDTYFLAD